MMDGEVGVIIARAGGRRPAVWRNMQKAHRQRREEVGHFRVKPEQLVAATCIAVEAPSPLACLKHLTVFAKLALVSRFAFVFGRFLFSSFALWGESADESRCWGSLFISSLLFWKVVESYMHLAFPLWLTLSPPTHNFSSVNRSFHHLLSKCTFLVMVALPLWSKLKNFKNYDKPFLLANIHPQRTNHSDFSLRSTLITLSQVPIL